MMDVMGNVDGELDADPRRAMLQRNQEVRLLSSQVLQLRMEMVDAREEADRQLSNLKRMIARLANNVARLANRPALRSRTFNTVAVGSAVAVGVTNNTSHHSRGSPSEQRGTTTTTTQPMTEPNAAAADDNLTNGNAVGNSLPASQSNSSTAEDAVPTVEEIRAAAASRAELGGQALEDLQMVETVVGRPRVLVARLSKCPKTLYDLWKEYMFGFSGNKPAKDFTRSERGACRYNYSKRNVVWQTIIELVKAGYSSDLAIDKIYGAYGHSTSNTIIIKKLAADNKHGGHPELRIRAS
jgi:hypothetical protein